ncbi:MAG: WhiB family transcriptional regulator [Acidimicrobiia bacterium]
MTGHDVNETWRTRAACRGLPTSLFYPVPGVPVGAALAVCTRCPVRSECDDFARSTGEVHGVWGGRTEEERAGVLAAATTKSRRRRPGPPPALDDEALIDLMWRLDPDRPAAAQVLDRLGVSVPTAYKYLRRAKQLGAVERRGRQLYPAS